MGAGKGCCTPPRGGAGLSDQASPVQAGEVNHEGSVAVPGGTALIGAARAQIPDDGEAPMRKAKLAPFRMGAGCVTNAEFAAFVEATGYVTEAERFGWSFVFWSDVAGEEATRGVVGTEWWRRVAGANWRDINGPGSQAVAWHADHPVVQVSWADARAYAAWVGGRLPTEAEWEHAARGGQGDVRFPWGDAEPDDSSYFPCNIWQGAFPQSNAAADGYHATAPAHSFTPNSYGLYNMVGNVWEWTADPFKIKSLKKHIKARMASMTGYKLLKGGSFLCHRSYCYRYRIAARSGNSPDSTTTHQGFRVVWDEAG